MRDEHGGPAPASPATKDRRAERARKLVSIVVPVYFNELNLPDTIPQLLDLQQKRPEYDFEFVFVEDGSGDRSLELLMEYRSRHPGTITVVKLTRNFGSMAAIQAGFSIADGDCIGLISADLQDPPELFLEMIQQWENGCKAVFAVRKNREEHALQKLLSYSYYALVRRFAIPGYPSGGFDFMLVDRQVVDEVNRIHEKNTQLLSLVFWLGYQAVMIPYVRRRRTKGRSRWTFRTKFKLFIDSFVSFSYVPIRFLSLVGILYAAGAFIYAAFLYYLWLTVGISVEGWTALMVALAFTSGIQMVMLGVLGEYLWRTLDEARKRPHYVVDEIYRRTG